MEDKGIAFCDACFVVDKRANAGTFCIDCDQNLCMECQLYHTKFPATRTHTIVQLKEMKINAIEETQTRSSLLRCDYHDLKEVKYFCFDHKDVYCSLCRAVKHAHCNEKPIVDICDVLETRDLENVLNTLDQLAGYIDNARQERQRQIREMKTMKENCIQEIQSLKQRIAMLFEQLDKNAGQKIVAVDRRVDELSEKATVYDDAMNHVSSLSHQVRKVFECGDKEAIFTAQTKAQKLKADYAILVEQCQIDCAPLKLVFNQDVQIIDLLSTCESLGEVNLQVIPVHDGNKQMVHRNMYQSLLRNETDNNSHVKTRIAPVRNQDMSTRGLAPTTPQSSNCPAYVHLQTLPGATPVHDDRSVQVVPEDMIQLFLSSKREDTPPVTTRTTPDRKPELKGIPPPGLPSPEDMIQLLLSSKREDTPHVTTILTPVRKPAMKVIPPPKLPSPEDMIQLLFSSKKEDNPHVTTRITPVRKSKMKGIPPPTLPSPPASPVEKGSCPQPLLYSQIVCRPSTRSNIPIQETRKSFLNIKLKNQKHYPVNVKEDKGDCDITGLAFWPSGNLVICDHNNRTVKVLDTAFHGMHCKSLDDPPWDVAAIGSDEVVVTMNTIKRVQFLKITSDGLLLGGSFHTKKMCWGIEAFNDNMIITFHDNPGNGFVEIRARKGEVLQHISNDDGDASIFISPFYVSLDMAKERFFVTDSHNNSVNCCTVTGKIQSVAKRENLKWPKGIVIDEDSNMIVSAFFTDQLKLLKNKRQCDWVKFCDTKRPQALAFRWSDLSLVVGTNEGKGIIVWTFENK